MTFPHSHKTIVILDHSPYFAESSNQSIDFDIFNKSRGVPGMIPLAPITKSLWTCNVEASLEYCRIVWDIFPTKKLVSKTKWLCCTLRPQFWNVPELFREVYNSGDSGVPGFFLLAILVCTRIVTQAILVRTRIVREFLTCLPSVRPSFLRHMN